MRWGIPKSAPSRLTDVHVVLEEREQPLAPLLVGERVDGQLDEGARSLDDGQLGLEPEQGQAEARAQVPVGPQLARPVPPEVEDVLAGVPELPREVPVGLVERQLDRAAAVFLPEAVDAVLLAELGGDLAELLRVEQVRRGAGWQGELGVDAVAAACEVVALEPVCWGGGHFERVGDDTLDISHPSVCGQWTLFEYRRPIASLMIVGYTFP